MGHLEGVTEPDAYAQKHRRWWSESFRQTARLLREIHPPLAPENPYGPAQIARDIAAQEK